MKVTFALLLVCMSSIVLFATRTDPPYGPTVVANKVVTLAAGTSFGLTTLYTPQENGIYNVYLFGNPCPNPGGAGVFVTDPSGTTTLVIGPAVAGAGVPIQWNGAASPTASCTLYVAIEKLS